MHRRAGPWRGHRERGAVAGIEGHRDVAVDEELWICREREACGTAPDGRDVGLDAVMTGGDAEGERPTVERLAGDEAARVVDVREHSQVALVLVAEAVQAVDRDRVEAALGSWRQRGMLVRTPVRTLAWTGAGTAAGKPERDTSEQRRWLTGPLGDRRRAGQGRSEDGRVGYGDAARGGSGQTGRQAVVRRRERRRQEQRRAGPSGSQPGQPGDVEDGQVQAAAHQGGGRLGHDIGVPVGRQHRGRAGRAAPRRPRRGPSAGRRQPGAPGQPGRR